MANALLSFAKENPDIVYLKPSARPQQTRKPNEVSTKPARVPEKPPPAKQLEYKNVPEGHKTVEKREGACKKKPTITAGNGGSRPFVPWCKK